MPFCVLALCVTPLCVMPFCVLALCVMSFCVIPLCVMPFCVLAFCVMPLCVLPFSVMPFAVMPFLRDTYMIVSFLVFLRFGVVFFFFTNFDSVYFRLDLTLFTFRLLNFVIDIPSYQEPIMGSCSHLPNLQCNQPWKARENWVLQFHFHVRTLIISRTRLSRSLPRRRF